MSAITGIFYRDGRTVHHDLIKTMNDRLSHRGPDGSRVWYDGYIAFGHQMLHTTPESIKEELPFEDSDSGLVITSDARIDNRAELAPLLGLDDVQDVSDSYFILKSYQKWGEKCPEKLLGDFVFAIWDQNRKLLFCARDHLGVKPFYYYITDDFFSFSTEIKALFTNSEVPRKLNENKIAFYLMSVTEDRVNTFYENIFRLPAAHRIKLGECTEIENYWQLNENKEIIMGSHEEYVNGFREIFEESVRCRLRSSFKLGSELSGGVDSSSIVGMVGEILGKKNVLDIFSNKFNVVTSCDESDYVLKLVEKGRINPHFMVGDNVSPIENLTSILNYIEVPSDTPNLTLYWRLYELVQKNDVRILLSGFDGDSALYRGEEYFKELAVKFQWRKLIHEINEYSNNYNFNKSKVFLNKVIFPLIPKKLKNLWNSSKNLRIKNDSSIFNKEFENKLDLNRIYREIHEIPLETTKSDSKKYHYYIINHGLHQSAFEFLDKLTAAFNIEMRYPLFDKRILEFCYAIPTDEKFRDGWDRILMRVTMDNLPEEIRWRPKTVTTLPLIERNLLLFEKNFLEKLFYQDLDIINNYIDLEEVINIYEKYKLKKKGRDVLDLYRLTNLIMWIQQEENVN